MEELELFKKKTKIWKIIWRMGFGKNIFKITNSEMGNGTWAKSEVMHEDLRCNWYFTAKLVIAAVIFFFL